MRKEQILSHIDQHHSLPWLDSDLFILANSRLTVFRDDNDWAIAIDLLAYWPSVFSDDGIGAMMICAHCCGTCLSAKPGISEATSRLPIRRGNDAPLLTSPSDPVGVHVNPDARSLMLRDKRIALPSPTEYCNAGVFLEDPSLVQPHELLRYLAWRYPQPLMLKESELAKAINRPLPILLRLDEWRHPDYRNGEIASELETFQMLAEVIESGDRKRYAPHEKPNTHWRNWPLAGII